MVPRFKNMLLVKNKLIANSVILHYSYIPIKSLIKVLIFEYCKMFLCVCRMRWKPIHIFGFVKLGMDKNPGKS